MFTEEERAFLARATTTMQIIVGSLIAGVVVFFGVVLLLARDKAGPPPDTPLLTYMSVAMAMVAIVVAMVLPAIIIRSQRRAIVAGQLTLKAGSIGGPPLAEAERALGPLVAGQQTALIIRAALLEGPAFFCLVAYMIEWQALSLAAAGMLILFLVGGFPTRGRVEDAIESERATIEQLRQMGPSNAR